MGYEIAHLVSAAAFVALAAFVMARLVGLCGEFRLGYLFSYLAFLVAWDLLGLLIVIDLLIAPRLLSESAVETSILLHGFLAIPLLACVLYAFTDFTARLSGRVLPGYVPAGFTVLAAAGLAGILLQLIGIIDIRSTQIPGFVVPVPLLVVAVVVYGNLLWLVLRRTEFPPDERRLLIIFVSVFVGGYTVSEGLKLVPGLSPGTVWGDLIVGSVYFGFHFPPILLLGRIAAVQQCRIVRSAHSQPRPDTLARRWGVTPRELEIIELVLDGKTNREIQGALGISLDTVKKHIYNIYRKIGVRNRIELANQIAHTDARRDS